MADGKGQFERIVRLARGLAGVAEGTSYGDPALLVGGKMFACLKNEETLVLRAPLEAKMLLFEVASDLYYETGHYVGWPYLLVRLQAIGDEELKLRLTDAWTARAPAKLLRAQGDGSQRA